MYHFKVWKGHYKYYFIDWLPSCRNEVSECDFWHINLSTTFFKHFAPLLKKHRGYFMSIRLSLNYTDWHSRASRITSMFSLFSVPEFIIIIMYSSFAIYPDHLLPTLPGWVIVFAMWVGSHLAPKTGYYPFYCLCMLWRAWHLFHIGSCRSILFLKEFHPPPSPPTYNQRIPFGSHQFTRQYYSREM